MTRVVHMMNEKQPQSRERKRREVTFHDRSFSTDLREPARKYHAVAGSSQSRFWELISEGCRDRRILDYGCGTGWATARLRECGAKVTGLDISYTGLRQASENAMRLAMRDVTFVQMDGEELGFPDDTFDCVCGTAILHHLDLELAYGEVGRVLRWGGKAVFIEPLGHNPFINLYRRLTPEMRTSDEHPLKVEDLKLAERFFETVSVEYYHLLTLLTIPLLDRSFFGSLVRTVDAVDSLLFRSVGAVRKFAWVAVICLRRPRREEGASRALAGNGAARSAPTTNLLGR